MSYSKVLTVLQLLPELHDGGVERGTVEMARYLTTKGYTPLVASAGGKRVKELEQSGISHIKLPLNRKNPFVMLANAWRLRGIIKRRRVKVVHARSRGPAWSGWLACKFTNAQFMTTFHGIHGRKGFLKQFYNSIMVCGKVVVANSGFVAEHIKTYYGQYLGQRSLLVAPRGADVTVFQPGSLSQQGRVKLRKALGVAPQGVLVVLVGRLSRWKGQDVLLRAVAELPEEVRNNMIVALAGGVDRTQTYLNELKALAQELGLGERVAFLGPRDDVAALYCAADIAVSASTRPEAFGRVAVEAMSCGTPIIATAHGGSLETVLDNETGLLVAPNNALELSVALEKLAKSPDMRAKFGATGAVHVRQNFSLENMCAQEFLAYKIILEK